MMTRTRVWRRGRRLGEEGHKGVSEGNVITMIPSKERERRRCKCQGS